MMDDIHKKQSEAAAMLWRPESKVSRMIHYCTLHLLKEFPSLTTTKNIFS